MKSPDAAQQGCNRRAGVSRAAALLGLLAVTAGTAWAASGGDAGYGGLSSSDWYRIMNFVVLAAGLVFLLRKPIPRALNSRIQGIQHQLSDLEARKADAEKRLAECNQQLGELEKEAGRIMNDYVRQGQEAKARILKEAESAAEKIQVQARRNIEHEFEQTKARLQREIFEQALAKAEALLKQNVTAEDQAHLVEDYLQKVVAS
ncbi:MAG TPA: ATP synthase F0 subunit B [Desulfobacterales bacterium]|jgi:F-type H+-transporting ATPase subunit b|nr:ATP synthase F0 subunit B [Desulfobacterales bacterium]